MKKLPVLNTIILYAKNMQKTATFYQLHFGFLTTGKVIDGLIELSNPNGGANILVHQAAKSLRLGHASIKLMFDVKDIEAFKKKSAKQGLKFGSTHQANGYEYANAKDPDKNSVSISSRAYRVKASRIKTGKNKKPDHLVG